MTTAKPRPTYRIDLTPTPAAGDPTRALRRALKALIRQYGLRCVRVEQLPAPPLPRSDGESPITHTENPR